MSTEIETDDRLTTQIAVMALVYRNLKQTGHNLAEDFEREPGEVSLLLMLSDEYLSTTDWDVIRALQFPHLQDRLTALYAALLELDERRAEALLHAWPTHEVQLPLVTEVAYERWDAVAHEIAFLEDAGVARSQYDIELIAEHAARAGAETILLDND